MSEFFAVPSECFVGISYVYRNIIRSGEMKHEMTLFHTTGPNRNVLCGHLLTQDDTGPFESPLLRRTPFYLVMTQSFLN